MSLSTLLGHDLVIHTYQSGAVDTEGNATESYSPAIEATTPVTKGYIQTESGSELDEGGRRVSVKRWVAYLHPEAVVGESDRVTWEGRVFDVVSVFDVWAPNSNHHKKVELKQSGWVNAS